MTSLTSSSASIDALSSDQRPTAKCTTYIDLGIYKASLNLDIDGSGGVPDAATDGMNVLRVMLGLVGAEVTAGLPIPANA